MLLWGNDPKSVVTCAEGIEIMVTSRKKRAHPGRLIVVAMIAKSIGENEGERWFVALIYEELAAASSKR